MALSMSDIMDTATPNTPRRLVVYGTRGVGKSTFGKRAPKPIFIQTEAGLGSIDAKAFPLSTTFDSVIDAMRLVLREKHDFETLVVDTLDGLEQLIFDAVCAEESQGGKTSYNNIQKIGYAKGYDFALTHWRRFLAGLDQIRNGRNMHIVLLAHSGVIKRKLPDGIEFDKIGLKLHVKAHDVVCDWADEVMYATYPATSDPNRVKVKGEIERVLMTRESPTYEAKNRLGLPTEIELSWDVYDQHRRSAMAKLTGDTTTKETGDGQSE